MPGTINNTARQDIQSIYARGIERSACATKMPAFINQVEKAINDPIELFKQHPHQTDNAKALVLHEVQKNLPADLLQKNLSPEGNKVRMLIGIIYKDVQDSGNAEDLAKLDKVCKKLAEANGNETKEQKVAKELSSLVSKYSERAFEKVTNKYIEHCMAAWDAHHQARSVDTHDKTIFTQDLDTCKSLIKQDVEGLTHPDQLWETMAQKLNFFINDCASISKTLTFHDANPVTPAPKGPEKLNANCDGGSDKQRVFIPTGPGQGGITLNITSQGGSVGNISHSVGAANSTPADPFSATAKHILDSGLTNVEKMSLIKDIYPHMGGGSNFLGNLAGVQGYKQEQAVDTLQQNVARREIETQTLKPELKSVPTQTEGAPDTEAVNDASLGPEPNVQQQPTIVVEQTADSVDRVGLRDKKKPSGSTSSSNGEIIYTTSLNIGPLNRRASTPRPVKPLGVETEPARARGNVEKLVAQFDALKQPPSSVFAHQDKNGAVASEGEKAKPTEENGVGKGLTDSLIRPKPLLPLNSQVRSDASGAYSAPASIKTANPGMDLTAGGMPRKGGEEVSRKSVFGGFQPTRINAATGNRSGNNPVYTTVRTVNIWNRKDPDPVSFVPKDSKSNASDLNVWLSKVERRNQSASYALDNKKIEQKIERDQGTLSYKDKLAYFRTLEKLVASHG